MIDSFRLIEVAPSTSFFTSALFCGSAQNAEEEGERNAHPRACGLQHVYLQVVPFTENEAGMALVVLFHAPLKPIPL